MARGLGWREGCRLEVQARSSSEVRGAAAVKLAFIHKAYGVFGGTERVLESLTRQLAERGHEIDVYAGWVDPRFGRSRFARFKKLWVVGPFPVLRSLALFLSSTLRVRRGRYDVVVHFGRTGPLDVYRCGGGCHRVWFELLLASAGGWFSRLWLRMSLQHRFVLWHERRALSSGGLIVAPSEQARRDLVAVYGEAAERVRVLPNGVDLNRFHPKLRTLFFEEQRQQLHILPEETLVVFVASDFWRKGLDRLLVAMEYVAQEVRDLRLLVVGEDRRRDSYDRMAESHGLRGKVGFAGEVDSPERIYAVADLLVLPTRYDPFANVTIEALACGLPVVTTRCNGAAEGLAEGDALALVDSTDSPEQLVAAMGRMLEGTSQARRREAARELAESLSEESAVDRWERLLARIEEG